MIWYPKSGANILNTLVGGGGGYIAQGSATDANSSTVEDLMPKKGDTVQILANMYGNFQIVQEGTMIPNGAKVIECEVKSIKKAVIALE